MNLCFRQDKYMEQLYNEKVTVHNLICHLSSKMLVSLSMIDNMVTIILSLSFSKSPRFLIDSDLCRLFCITYTAHISSTERLCLDLEPFTIFTCENHQSRLRLTSRFNQPDLDQIHDYESDFHYNKYNDEFKGTLML